MPKTHQLWALDSLPDRALQQASEMYLNWRKSFPKVKIISQNATVASSGHNGSLFHAFIWIVYTEE